MTFSHNSLGSIGVEAEPGKSDANHCQTKFIWRIKYMQFRYQSYPEPCEAYCAKADFFGKPVPNPTLHLFFT
jgi:hypothetical protein